MEFKFLQSVEIPEAVLEKMAKNMAILNQTSRQVYRHWVTECCEPEEVKTFSDAEDVVIAELDKRCYNLKPKKSDTVYAIWSGCGEYEDYCEGIEGIYAEKADAEAALCDFVMQEKERAQQAEKCYKCPCLDGMRAGYNYCPHQEKVEEDEYGNFDCEYYDGYYYETRYWIKEYEVR